MADIKISALPAVTSVVSSDIFPTVAGSTTSKITTKNLADSLTQVSSSISASFAITASYVLGGGNTINTSSFITTGSASSTQSISGSLLISGSIIPAVSGVSSTSSFNLGSATNAWKDIYVSDGTINFINGAGIVQGTLSSVSGGLQLGNSIVSGNLDISGSIGFVDSLNTSLYGADYISGRYLAGTPTYRGIFNPGFTTGSIQPVISTDWTVSYAVVGSGIFQNTKYVTSDLGIGLEYNNFQSPAKASPAIKIAFNSSISEFNSSTNIYEAGYSTIVTNNRNLSNLEAATDWSFQFGTYHALTVTGSFLSRDNTNLGTNINNYTRITGNLRITGSANITGSLNTSGSFTHTGGYTILTNVSSSLNFLDDAAAASGGVPLGGLYRNGNAIQIRLV
jgi:hypothetical protein